MNLPARAIWERTDSAGGGRMGDSIFIKSAEGRGSARIGEETRMEASARMGVDMAFGRSPSRSNGGRLEVEVLSEREWARGGSNEGWNCSNACSWTAESIKRSRRPSPMLASLSAGFPCLGRGETDEARGGVSSRSTVGISSEFEVATPGMGIG